MAKPKKKDNELVKHHIIPRSRGGENTPTNIAFVRRVKHISFHILFANKTPEEIIEYLVYRFWGGDWSWLDKVKERYRR